MLLGKKTGRCDIFEEWWLSYRMCYFKECGILTMRLLLGALVMGQDVQLQKLWDTDSAPCSRALVIGQDVPTQNCGIVTVQHISGVLGFGQACFRSAGYGKQRATLKKMCDTDSAANFKSSSIDQDVILQKLWILAA